MSPSNALLPVPVIVTSPSFQSVSPEMVTLLRALRKKVAIGVVGGSDFVKVSEQLTVPGSKGLLSPSCRLCVPSICVSHEPFCLTRIVTDDFDFMFAENGLTAYKLGIQLPSQSFIHFIGEERYKSLVNFTLHYLADIDLPIKRYVQPQTRLSLPMPLD